MDRSAAQLARQAGTQVTFPRGAQQSRPAFGGLGAAVRAKVASVDAFSGHADKNELKRYVENLTGNLKKIFVVHGEEPQAMPFAETLRQLKPQAEVVVPAYKQTETV